MLYINNTDVVNKYDIFYGTRLYKLLCTLVRSKTNIGLILSIFSHEYLVVAKESKGRGVWEILFKSFTFSTALLILVSKEAGFEFTTKNIYRFYLFLKILFKQDNKSKKNCKNIVIDLSK